MSASVAMKSVSRLKIAQMATIDLSARWLMFEQVRALQRAGHEVVIVCAPGKWVGEMRSLGVPVATVEMARELRPLADLRSLRALVRCFREHRFDVVHTHTPKAGLIGPVAARLAGVRAIVHTAYGLMFHDRMPWWRQALFWVPEKITATCCHRLLAQSREDMEAAVRTRLCSRAKLAYEGNGVDVRRFAPAQPRAAVPHSEGTVVVGSVGRLVYEKGFGELFTAAEMLAKKHKQLKFLVVGPADRDQSDAIPPRRIEELHQRGVVTFTGWRDDMPQCYAAMDIFVLPSHREGIPRSGLEAAAMGLPVIASDIRGCREIVRDGETGLLVPVRDAAALADAIEQLAREPEDRRRMGARGRELVCANFDEKLVNERTIRFYEELQAELNGRRRP